MTYILGILVGLESDALDKIFYYLYSSDNKPKKWCRVLVNFNNIELVGFINEIKEANNINNFKLPYKIKEITKIIDEKPILNEELYDLALFLKKYYFNTLVSCLNMILPYKLRIKNNYEHSIYKNNNRKNNYVILNKDVDLNNFKLNLYEQRLINKVITHKLPIKLSDIKSSKLQKLLDLNILNIIDLNKKYEGFADDFNYNFKLSCAQTEAYLKITKSINKNIILKGVTGSGKTEIYIKLIKDILGQNKSVIYLVSQINQLFYLEIILNQIFGNKITFLSSNLTKKEFNYNYSKIINSEVKIVVGTSFAIFAPLKNLGLIIVDEEYSNEYINKAKSPFFDTVEVAHYRAKKNNSILLLGSATPSILRYSMAKKGLFKIVELNERYYNKILPIVKTINMNIVENLYPGYSIFSKELINSIHYTLLNKKKVFIISNHNDFSKTLICDNCGELLTCPCCQKNLSFNIKFNKYYCHNCDIYFLKNNISCSKCNSNNFSTHDYGSEFIVENLKKLFPYKKIEIYNSKSTTKIQYFSILNKFKNNEIDILVGSSLLSKGHDFKNIGLVAVLGIDNYFNLKNYKSNEDLYDLLVQTIGRSGREKGDNGFCLIQTKYVENKILKLALLQDYDLFYETIMKERRNTDNPPFYFLFEIKLISSNLNDLKNANLVIKNNLIQNFKNEKFLNFYVSKIYKRRKEYLSIFTIKTKNNEEITKYLNLLKSNFHKITKNSKIYIYRKN